MKRLLGVGFACATAAMMGWTGLAVAQTSAQPQAQPPQPQAQPAQPQAQPQEAKSFPEIVTQFNNNEIAEARLALQKSQNQEVRQFAENLVREHSDLENKVLQKMGQQQPPRVAPTERQRESFQRLAQLQGADFDRQFAEHMVKDHERAIQTLEKFANDKSSKWSATANTALSAVREHLQHAQKLSSDLQNQKGQQGQQPQGQARPQNQYQQGQQNQFQQGQNQGQLPQQHQEPYQGHGPERIQQQPVRP